MKLGLCIGLFFLYLTSCKLILEQEWGPNLAQEATSLEPNLIDGNLGTKAAIPLRLTDLHKLSGYPPAEIVIQLKSVKEIRRIIVHSQDLKDFQIWAYNGTEGNWQPIALMKSHQPPSSTVKVKVKTDRIKIKVNNISVLGVRRIAKKLLNNQPIISGQSIDISENGLINRLKLLGQNLDQINGLQPQLPTINEIEMYGIK